MSVVAVGIIALIAFLFGFLIGWLLEWRIDLSYWHSYFEEVEKTEGDEAVMILPAATAPPQLPSGNRQETLVIQTLREQLAQRDNNEGRWREVSAAREAELIEEARRLRLQVDDLTAAKNDTDAEWRHELALREQQWQESKQAETAAVLVENRRLKEHAEALEKRFARYKSNHPAELSTIKGIGPKLQSDLRRTGINSYAELGSRTPDELRVLLNPPKWRKLDFESWIAQAQILARNEEE